MERRTFLRVMAGSLLAAPLVAGQPAQASPRLGMLLTGSPSDRGPPRELDALWSAPS
jgi:hypothetical protein